MERVESMAKDRLLIFQEALNLDAELSEKESKESLTPEEMTKFTRLLKLMVWLDMDQEDRVLH